MPRDWIDLQYALERGSNGYYPGIRVAKANFEIIRNRMFNSPWKVKISLRGIREKAE
jgi:hypothetical protein